MWLFWCVPHPRSHLKPDLRDFCQGWKPRASVRSLEAPHSLPRPAGLWHRAQLWSLQATSRPFPLSICRETPYTLSLPPSLGWEDPQRTTRVWQIWSKRKTGWILESWSRKERREKREGLPLSKGPRVISQKVWIMEGFSAEASLEEACAKIWEGCGNSRSMSGGGEWKCPGLHQPLGLWHHLPPPTYAPLHTKSGWDGLKPHHKSFSN